jgi:CRISPR system Cascade subunit CasB
MPNEARGLALDEFVSRLEDLSHADHARVDLARLKRSAGSSLADSPDVFPLFYRLLPPMMRGNERDEDRLFLVATLFAINPRSMRAADFGATMARLAATRANGREGIDRRIAVLLDAEAQDLPFRLRQLVTLAAAAELGVNWRGLTEDLLWWDQPARRVQRRWARSYFGGPAPRERSDAESSSSADTKE